MYHISFVDKYKVPISIIATGMGFPMMDFVVRETRAIVDGEMAIIRYYCIDENPRMFNLLDWEHVEPLALTLELDPCL